MEILYFKCTTMSLDSPLFLDYLIGAVIAFFILGYLVYSLIRPEKF